jgi:hypothetical protein
VRQRGGWLCHALQGHAQTVGQEVALGTSLSRQPARRRSLGVCEAGFFDTDSMFTEPEGCTVAVAWKVTVAGRMGATSDSMPPRRIGTPTATSSPSEIWRAFQLSAAVTTYRRRPAAAHTTPLARGLPAGVTWLMTANEAFWSSCQTCSAASVALHGRRTRKIQISSQSGAGEDRRNPDHGPGQAPIPKVRPCESLPYAHRRIQPQHQRRGPLPGPSAASCYPESQTPTGRRVPAHLLPDPGQAQLHTHDAPTC